MLLLGVSSRPALSTAVSAARDWPLWDMACREGHVGRRDDAAKDGWGSLRSRPATQFFARGLAVEQKSEHMLEGSFSRSCGAVGHHGSCVPRQVLAAA